MSAVFLLGLVTVLQVSALPDGPQRDARPTSPTGTGVIAGRVLAADSGLPLRRAVVYLGGGPQQKTVQTDADGRYAVTKLPPGTYTVMANAGPHRADYLSRSYGASLPDGFAFGPRSRARPIQLEAGVVLDNIDIRLPRAAAITGQVVDGFGEPVSRVYVRALLALRGRQVSEAAGAATDDTGRYRLFGLPPGDYVVTAASTQGDMGVNDGEPVGFALTYAPGTGSLAQATRIKLVAGAVANADLQLVETRLFTISGVVLTSSGEPPRNTGVSAVRADIEHDAPGFGAGISQSGAFTIRNVAPGSYVLHVRHSPEPIKPMAFELAMVRVEVAGDVEGLVLATRPGETVDGEIVFDDGVTEGRRVFLSAPETRRRMFSDSPTIEVNGARFTMRGIFSPVIIRGGVQAAGTNLWLKAVLLDGRDVTEVPTAFTSRDSGRLQVVFTSRAPIVEGVVTDEAGAPVEECTVVAFGEDPSSWIPMSLSIRGTRSSSKGKYLLPGLREGRYRVVAVPIDMFFSMDQPDVELLEALKKVAIPVLLNAGETRTVDLRIVRFDQ